MSDRKLLSKPVFAIPGPAPAINVTWPAVLAGSIYGGAVLLAAAVGVLGVLQERVVVSGIASLGQVILVFLGVRAGISARSRHPRGSVWVTVWAGAVAGAVYGIACYLVAVIASLQALRSVFIALTPRLREVLAIGEPNMGAATFLVASGIALGILGACWHLAWLRLRQVMICVSVSVIAVGTLQELIQVALRRFEILEPVRALIFSWEGLTATGAVVVSLAVLVIGGLWRQGRHLFQRHLPVLAARCGHHRRSLLFISVFLGLALLPLLAGSYIGQVLLLVGLYTLMGMGLNIEVGLAGLLDLGFVAFFAVGAYATALLTANSPFAIASYTIMPSLSFWQAAPIAVMLSVGVGVLFGLPVLGVRGDYLAIATLGLGEIVRVIVLSDLAAPVLGGAQGILQIPKPKIGTVEMSDPISLFYVTLIFSLIAAFIAWRLQKSRLGRAWLALRDDEDVAQSLGINLVRSKLLAYGLGAAFAGLAGAIFATMLTSVYPNSFTLIVSINVLALIVIGGAGSLRGVAIGALILVGLPEILREFGEYRLLIYGIALVAVMLFKPQGLWPQSRAAEIGGTAGGVK